MLLFYHNFFRASARMSAILVEVSVSNQFLVIYVSLLNKVLCYQHGDIPRMRESHAASVSCAPSPQASADAGRAPPAAHGAQHVRRGALHYCRAERYVLSIAASIKPRLH